MQHLRQAQVIQHIALLELGDKGVAHNLERLRFVAEDDLVENMELLVFQIEQQNAFAVLLADKTAGKGQD